LDLILRDPWRSRAATCAFGVYRECPTGLDIVYLKGCFRESILEQPEVIGLNRADYQGPAALFPCQDQDIRNSVSIIIKRDNLKRHFVKKSCIQKVCAFQL